MSDEHNHSGEGAEQSAAHAGHDHTAGASTSRLAIALGLTTAFLIAELVGAYWFGSLALLSDAAHMFTDAAALAIALAAIRIGQKEADEQRTFGYRRFEILAAAFNAVLLFVVAAYVLYEGIVRFFSPEPVESVGMLIVAGIGLVVNLIAMRVLSGGKDHSLNMKGAYLEVWADMLGSLGVIGAAIAIWVTGKMWIDPMVAIAIGLWVLPRTWILLRDTTHVLLEGVPRHIDIDAVRKSMGQVHGVISVHELHIWSVAGNDVNLTAHVAISDGTGNQETLDAISALLRKQYAITHSTIQLEAGDCEDQDTLHI